MENTGYKGKILFMANWQNSVPEVCRKAAERVEAAGYQADFHPNPIPYSAEELGPMLKGYVAAVIGGQHVEKVALDQADCLKVIARNGAGFDNIDIAECTKRGIVVSGCFGASSIGVAEIALGLMMNVSLGINQGRQCILEDRWFDRIKFPSVSLYGKTVGIVGIGFTGKAVADRCKALGMKVIYFDVRRNEEAEAEGMEYRELDQLICEADYVSLHCALNEHTYHMIDERRLKMMKPTAYLINTSRGGTVDEDALLKALKEGEIAGAGLDVFEPEPTKNFELCGLPNVVATPHMAGIQDTAKAMMMEMTVDHLLDSLAGKKPEFCHNPELFD